ncbi:Magnesium transporter NIPA [Ceratobasidium sp. AG-Ba]|nr:Magnesium transporter NIPA [Ceratobasidium sp. AG-Ba]
MVVEDAGPQVSVALGITIGLLASFVQSLGLTVQRKSHLLNQACSEEDRRPDYRRPLWLIGFGIFISSNILGSIFQIASLPVVILAPLGAVSLLWNAFFARLILGDVFSKYMVLGTIFIATGAVLIAVFGIVSEPTHSLDDLLRLFRRPTFVVYFALLGAAVLVALVITHVAEWRLTRQGAIRLDESTPTPPLSPIEGDIPNENDSERTPLFDGKPNPPPYLIVQCPTPHQRTATWIAIAYASASGLLSGMCLLFAKSGVELLVLTIAGQNQFWRWESWILVLGLGVFALLQLWYLHKSLTLADPTLVCPLAFCFYNLSSIVNGLVYFDQISELSGFHLTLVILGIFILLGGVWAVSIQQGGGVKEGAWVDEDADQDEVERAVALRDTFSGSEHSLEPMIDPSRPLVISPNPASESPSQDPFHDQTRTSCSPTGEPIPSASRRRNIHIRTGSLDAPSPPISPQRRSGTRPRYGTLLGAEAPPGALVAPGFSIGLSPVSPGFALIPRARRQLGLRSISEGSAAPDAETQVRTSGNENGGTARRKWTWVKNLALHGRQQHSMEQGPSGR